MFIVNLNHIPIYPIIFHTIYIYNYIYIYPYKMLVSHVDFRCLFPHLFLWPVAHLIAEVHHLAEAIRRILR
jgi:predicted transglutaminase-like protease